MPTPYRGLAGEQLVLEKALPPLPGVLWLPSLHAIRLTGQQHGLRGTARSKLGCRAQTLSTHSFGIQWARLNLQLWVKGSGAQNLPLGCSVGLGSSCVSLEAPPPPPPGLAQGVAPGAWRPGPHRCTARSTARWCRTLEVL